MLCESLTIELKWKNIKDDIWTSQFISPTSKQNIYLKKIIAKKEGLKPITLFLFHDLTSYHGRFHHLTTWFQNNFPEVSFVMMDYAGHGLSNGTRAHVEDMSWLIDDMALLMTSLEKEKNDIWIALGQGMGAIGLLDLINRMGEENKKKIDKLVLTNFILSFSSAAFVIAKEMASKLRFSSGFIKQSRPMSIYHSSEMLSSIQEQVNYLKDPLITHSPTFRSLTTINERVKNLFQDSYFLDKPTLMLSSHSPYLVQGGMESFSKGFKKGLLTKKYYSNFNHDLYNESESQIVFNDIYEWIKL